MNLLQKLFKPKSQRDFSRHAPILDEVNRHAASYEGYTEEQFRAKTDEFRSRLAAGETPDDILPEAYALVKTACKALVGTSWEV